MRTSIWFGILLCSFTYCQSRDFWEPPVDLVLRLPEAKSQSTNQTDPLPYHWKKNPGRSAGLPRSRKWENTQITFNTDRSVFLNHSQDAIFFPKSQSYSFGIPKQSYTFRFQLGLLAVSPNGKFGSGVFQIKSGNEILWQWKERGQDLERWMPIEIKINLPEPTLTLSWESEDSVLYVAQPLLYPDEIDSPPPSVILIVIDSLRKDFVGAYGYPYNITPNMDLMAKESVFFENPFSNGNWTKPSMMSFFHSEYSSNLGLGNSWFTTKPYQRKVYYGKKRDNLVRSFREKGYYTKSIMNNVFFLDYTTVGVDLGFHDTYQVGKDIDDTEVLTKHALEFVSEYKDKPYFLHFNLNTPHASYSPPAQDLAEAKKRIPAEVFYKYESPIQRYIGEVFYTDRMVGKLIQKLKDLGVYDNTLLVVTGDHGELFSPEHDYSYHFIMQTRFGHGETHYDEEINVPYWIKLPRSIQKNVKAPASPVVLKEKQIRIPGQSSLLSLAPTILGFLGYLPETSTFRGANYSECLLKTKECPKETFIYTEGRMSESVRTETYKYIRRYPGFTTVRRTAIGEPHTMAEELYHLPTDPFERKNLSQDPQAKDLLTLARSDFQREGFLQRNQLHVSIPKCKESTCRDEMSLSIQGSVYDWVVFPKYEATPTSAKTLVVQTNPSTQISKLQEIIVKTVNPELGVKVSFFRNGKSLPVRIGRYGLESPNLGNLNEGLDTILVSERKPVGWESSELPWVYNDGRFSGGSESEIQKEMGKEVKKILETWGYIHE